MEKRDFTICLVDDSSLDNTLNRRVIERGGRNCHVIEFTYAEDALCHLAEHGPGSVDLILLDINMPRMNGFEFLEAAVAAFRDAVLSPVVVMLTTSLQYRDRQRAEQFAMLRGYISKPLIPATLVEIFELLDGTRDRLSHDLCVEHG